MNRFIFTVTTSFADIVERLIKKYEFNHSIITIKRRYISETMKKRVNPHCLIGKGKAKGILLDLFKEFNIIVHRLLMGKLHGYGFNIDFENTSKVLAYLLPKDKDQYNF